MYPRYKTWFEENGKECKAVIGISGGIDSSVVVALCKEALGEERVLGIMMLQGRQKDIDESILLCKHLDIPNHTINIGDLVNTAEYEFSNAISMDLSEQTKINIPARIRMATLYAVSQTVNGRVVNTSNLSESFVGYDTRWGDSVGDYSPLFNLTKTEIRQLAIELELPKILVHKQPQDGLCGQTDEEKFGFTYEQLDKYIRCGEIEDLNIKEKITYMHEKNLFKLMPMCSYIPSKEVIQFD